MQMQIVYVGYIEKELAIISTENLKMSMVTGARGHKGVTVGGRGVKNCQNLRDVI